MKTLKLKCTEESEGRLSLQHPLAEPGFDGRVQTFEIKGVPDQMPDSKVVLLANSTVFMAANVMREDARWSFDFAEIGHGKIIRK